MYNNYGGSKIVISYTFLGIFVNNLSRDEIDQELEYIGLNDLVNDLTEVATNNRLTVDETALMLHEEFEDFIDEYEEDNKADFNRGLNPVLDSIILVDIKDYDETGRIKYDVYSFGDPEIDEATRVSIKKVLETIPPDTVNTNLLIVIVDIVKYGEPICQIYL